jgi:hypothetical protein
MAREMANSDALSGDAKPPTIFQSLLNRMEIEASIEPDQADSTILQGVEAILTADDEETMWVADDLTQTGGRDLRDVEQEILRFRIKRSLDPEINTPFVDSQGRKMYLLVDAVKIANGDQFTWNTSAPLVVAKIFWLEDHDKLPYECVIKGTDLAGARTILKLKPIPQRAVKSERA